MWPEYSRACINDVAALLRRGGSLSAYRASSAFPDWIGPRKDSEAWRFEREVEKAFKVRHCVAVNSGTAALHGALVALGVGPGDEVVVSPYTFSASASAILLAGAVPRFCDIDPFNFCATPETVRPHINKRTKAIIVVHLFGYFQNLEGFKEFGVPVVEDACQAVGARRGQAWAGTSSVAGALSFNGGKNLPTGEGGAVVTNDAKLARKIQLFVNHQENFGTQTVGVNYRMQEVVACIARHGLRELEVRNARRRELVERVNSLIPWYAFSDYNEPEHHVFYVAPLILSDRRQRASFIKRCAKRGLAVQSGYTLPLHHLPAFKTYATRPLPVVDDVHDRLVLITTLTSDRKLSYADEVASIISEALK